MHEPSLAHCESFILPNPPWLYRPILLDNGLHYYPITINLLRMPHCKRKTLNFITNLVREVLAVATKFLLHIAYVMLRAY